MTTDHVTVAEEEYLQILYWLHEAGLPMTAANVARAMQLSAPTVHEMIGRLERDGYITRGMSKSQPSTDKFKGRYRDEKNSPAKFTAKKGEPVDLGEINLTTN